MDLTDRITSRIALSRSIAITHSGFRIGSKTDWLMNAATKWRIYGHAAEATAAARRQTAAESAAVATAIDTWESLESVNSKFAFTADLDICKF